MVRDRALRLRLLLLTLSLLLAWLAWREARDAAAEVETARLRSQAAATADAAGREQAGREARFAELAAALERRDAPPETPGDVREALVGVARGAGVELATSRVQPLLRSPTGTRGAEVRVSAEGDAARLRHFLNAVEQKGWPLRTDRIQLGLRDADRASLAAEFTILWPDPEVRFTDTDAASLVADPRIGPLAAWLTASLAASLDAPDHAVSPSPLEFDPAAMVAVPAVAPPGFEEEFPEAPPATGGAPRLLGFVEVGPGTAPRAALAWRDEMTLVSVGDRIGDYEVAEIELAGTVLLVRPDAPPLRLTLR